MTAHSDPPPACRLTADRHKLCNAGFDCRNRSNRKNHAGCEVYLYPLLRQCAPDRPTLLDIVCLAQGGDGIALDRFDVQKVIEEPIDNAGAVQQRRRHPMVGQCLQPNHQNILAELGIAFSDVLELFSTCL